MKAYTYLIVVVFLTGLISCDMAYNNNGLFGHSKTKDEALKNGSPVTAYVADQASFALLDGTTLIIDTAWTECSFTFRNGDRVLDSTNGFHLSIPFKKEIPESFTFTFSLLDKDNEAFTNGITENLCQVCPKRLFDTMLVVLEQKDPDSNKGWTHPIVTDTIRFRLVR